MSADYFVFKSVFNNELQIYILYVLDQLVMMSKVS
jgi:hypothetical protein